MPPTTVSTLSTLSPSVNGMQNAFTCIDLATEQERETVLIHYIIPHYHVVFLLPFLSSALSLNEIKLLM